jgi:hypothetical protein
MKTKENAPVGRGGVVLYNSYHDSNYSTPANQKLNVPRKPCAVCGEPVIPLAYHKTLCRDCLVPQSRERRELEILALRRVR